MAFHPYTKDSRKLWVKLVVSFPELLRPNRYEWDAILDTGSPFTVLPGLCNGDALTEAVRVDLQGHAYIGQSITLPVRGGPVRFGGVGAPVRPHLPFRADLTLPGFGTLPRRRILFENTDHAIVGTDTLFHRKSLCLLRTHFRAGRCLLGVLCR
jgi:hypothetical protein